MCLGALSVYYFYALSLASSFAGGSWICPPPIRALSFGAAFNATNPLRGKTDSRLAPSASRTSSSDPAVLVALISSKSMLKPAFKAASMAGSI